MGQPADLAANRDDILHDVLKRISRRRSRFALVIPNGRRRVNVHELLGVVGKDRIADSVMQHFKQ